MKASLGLVLFLLLLLPTSASAETAGEYGPWSAGPGAAGTTAYDPTLEPWSSPDLKEKISWACIDSRGRAISPADRELLSQIYLAGADVYAGRMSFGAGAVLGGTPSAAPPNGGYPQGERGMQAFVRNEKSLLRRGLWTPYSARALLRKDGRGGAKIYRAATPGWQIFLGESGSSVRPRQGKKVAALLNDRAKTPLSLSEKLPEACGMQIGGLDQPTLQTQLLRPGDFLIDQVLYVPGRLAASSFEFVQPYAFSYTFWTPHTERADLLWDAPEDCRQDPGFLDRRERADGCVRGEALGWTASGYEDRGERSWFIVAAQILQWLISGTYMLILFSAAIVYMFRGHRYQHMHVLRILPRIILSIILTLFAGVILGAAISLSNMAVGTIFEWNATRPLGSLNSILLQAGNITGGPDLVQRLVELGTSVAAVFFYIVFILFSLARQIALVGLVILAPLAAMTLIVPRWRVYFRTYVRIFAVCLIVPVALAFVLKIGMSINPLVLDPEGAYGNPEGFLGLLLLLVTFWIMYRVIRFSFEYAKTGGPLLQPLLDAGRRLARGEISSPGEGVGGALVPANREALAATGTLAAATALPAAPPAPAREKETTVSERLRKNPGNRDRKRISAGAARKWRSGLKAYLERCQEKAGRKLNREEMEQATEKYRERVGDLNHEGGSWYLSRLDPGSPEGGEGETKPRQLGK